MREKTTTKEYISGNKQKRAKNARYTRPLMNKAKKKRNKIRSKHQPSVKDINDGRLDSVDMDIRSTLSEAQFGYGRKRSAEWDDSQAFALEKRLNEIAVLRRESQQ